MARAHHGPEGSRAAAIARAVAVVQRGEPALIDVVTDPR